MEAKESNKGRKAILVSAKKLFWKYGIRRVTVEEICKEAGVSKMTFYRAYKNKNEVAEKILLNLMDEGMKKFQDIRESREPFPEKIKHFIRLKYEGTQEISREFFNEVYQLDELNLKERTAEFRQRSTESFISFINAPENKTYLKEDLKPDFLLYMIDKINEIVLDDRFLSMFDSTRDAVVSMTDFFFYGIFKHKE